MHEEIQRIKQRFRIIGNAKALNRAIEVAVQVASTDLTVLITGESGSGKESFSRIIHSLSVYKHGNFIALNCGAIPEGTIDSELFGHEKGSFTGATEARKGYFEEANGGTIFLDEVGEMPLSTQARLLRVLEYGEFIRVGSSKVQKIKVRVVAATNVNLLRAVEKGKFREDLYYRLNTVPIYVPPLRERNGDILLLFRRFASDFSDQYRIAPLQLGEDAQKVILTYPFPGNIRQLKNLVEQMSVLEVNRTISADTLRHYLPAESPFRFPKLANISSTAPHFSEKELLYKVLMDMKKDVDELKILVFDLLLNNTPGAQLIEAHPALFARLDKPATKESGPIRLLNAPVNNDIQVSTPLLTREVAPQEDPELSIEATEQALIRKALEKHNHKRKNAAQSLGISERTLYRKIKQYHIDE